MIASLHVNGYQIAVVSSEVALTRWAVGDWGGSKGWLL